MDKAIRKIKKGVEKSEHQLESLEKMDKRQDRIVAKAKKSLKKGKKK